MTPRAAKVWLRKSRTVSNIQQTRNIYFLKMAFENWRKKNPMKIALQDARIIFESNLSHSMHSIQFYRYGFLNFTNGFVILHAVVVEREAFSIHECNTKQMHIFSFISIFFNLKNQLHSIRTPLFFPRNFFSENLLMLLLSFLSNQYILNGCRFEG